MDKKILVAEDSSVVHNLIKKIFQQLNYSITSAKDGKEALDYLSKDDYDIVLMDINMPVMDGMTATKKIRELSEDKNQIPIIAISGNSKNYTLEDFKNVGINEYLQKPFDYDVLVEIVRKYTS